MQEIPAGISIGWGLSNGTRTKQNVIGAGHVRALARPLKMLILADPKGDLKEAYLEGTQIRDYLDREKDLINASLQTDNVSSDFIKEKMRNFDLVHFAGHHDYDPLNPQRSGWRLTDGGFKAQDILKMVGAGFLPVLESTRMSKMKYLDWPMHLS